MAKVGIIEDSSLVVDMLTMVCQQEGHSVDSFERFGDAASAFASDPPDIVITDLNLPDIPEGATLDELREISELSDTPVIVVSARPREELQRLAENAGANGALSKDDGMPVISAELPKMIEQLT